MFWPDNIIFLRNQLRANGSNNSSNLVDAPSLYRAIDFTDSNNNLDSVKQEIYPDSGKTLICVTIHINVWSHIDMVTHQSF